MNERDSNEPFNNFVTLEDLDNELEDLDKVYIDYVENEKEYIKFIQTQLINRRRHLQKPLSIIKHPQVNLERELPIITNKPISNIKKILPYQNNNQNINPIIENKNIKSIYLTKLSFFGIVLSVNLMYYLIYYSNLNLKRLTYN